MKPITPQEALDNVEKAFPEFVFEAVNNCINQNYFGKSSFTIKQDEIMKEILKLAPEGTTRQEVFDKHWMDFENAYRKVGWVVEYDKPGYNETYDAFFTFKVKK